MLDYAQLSIEFTNFPFSIQLIFYVVGTDQKVIFDCSDIVSFHLDKEPHENVFTVLETHVIEPKKQGRRRNQTMDLDFSIRPTIAGISI